MYRDPYPTLEDTIRAQCDTCAGMGEALRCADDGTWAVIPCPDCGQNGECEMAELTGRELDAEVARVVFGRTVIWINDHRGVRHPYLPMEKPLVSTEYVYNYSTDIAAAWQVAEKMREKTGVFMLEWWQETSVWACMYEFHENEFTELSGGARVMNADTAPEAICRAALEVFAPERGDAP